MSKNLDQIFVANPITTNASTDLMYFMQSPYTAGTDAGMTYANFAAQFGAPYTAAALNGNSDTNVTITLSGTPTTALLHAATITMGWSGQLSSARGGTGVNNGTSTFTIGGNFQMTGAFTFNGTLTGNTAVTFPTSGTLATTSQLPAGAALTEVNDTNVTLTLGGSPTTALLNAASITAGWTGQLALTRGGTNNSLTASAGGIVWSDASKLNILAGTATANQILLSGNAATPSWSTTTYPATNAINTIMYATSANTLGSIAAANNGTLITSATGVPSWLANSGTAGFVLTANSGAPPSWAANSPSTLVTSATASNSATISLTGMTGFTSYYVIFVNVAPVTSGSTMIIRFSTNNGSTYDSGANYNWLATVSTTASGTPSATGVTSDTSIPQGGAAASNQGGIMYVLNPAASARTTVLGNTFFVNSGGGLQTDQVNGHYVPTTTVNAIQFSMSAGNISTGIFYLYGIK